MRGEPVRGRTPDPGFSSLPGLEQCRVWLRGLAPLVPLHFLTGMTLTQAGPGTASGSMPASPWIQTLDGTVEFRLLLEAVLELAVCTGAPPAHAVQPAAVTTSSLRPCTIKSETILARACTVNSGPRFTLAWSPRDVPEEMTHLEAFRAIMAGDLPPPPVHELLDIRIVEASEGVTAGTLHASEWLCLGTTDVMPGVLRESPRAAAGPDRVLAAVLFTDIVGSTRPAGELGDARWRDLLEEHHAVVRRQLGLWKGREVKTTGDGFLATFDSPGRAVQCARAVRDGLRQLGLEVRVGLHTGECEVSGADVAGIAVHLASRVQALAGPGEILLSGTVHDLVTGSGLRFTDRGRHALKGLDGQGQLFALEGE